MDASHSFQAMFGRKYLTKVEIKIITISSSLNSFRWSFANYFCFSNDRYNTKTLSNKTLSLLSADSGWQITFFGTINSMNRPAVSLMDLSRVSEFDSAHRQTFEDADLMQFEVWTMDKERIGKVSDILMDDIGQLYYIVVNIGSWINRKLVLIEPEQFRIDRQAHRINLVNIRREQVGQLQGYDPNVHGEAQGEAKATIAPNAYSLAPRVMPVESSVSLESSAPLDSTPLVLESSASLGSTPLVVETQTQPIQAYRSTLPSDHDRSISPQPVPRQSVPEYPTSSKPGLALEADLADLPTPIASPVTEQETFRLLEERLVINRLRRKVGEVVIRKEIETRIVEVPLRREKLIIEQVSPELKHIATVDLPSQLSDDELTSFAQASLNSIEASEFVSAEMAQRVLANLSQRNSALASKVKLVFEDKKLQAEYERQLAQIRDR